MIDRGNVYAIRPSCRAEPINNI